MEQTGSVRGGGRGRGLIGRPCKRGEHAAFRERRAMRTRLQGATRLEPLGDPAKRESGRATSRQRAERGRHPAGRSGVPAGLITAGTDGT